MSIARIRLGVANRHRYWFPTVRKRDRGVIVRELARFYESSQPYHAMTANEGKVAHPQVQLLRSMLRTSDRCLEVGCGGGVVLAAASTLVREAVGVDVSELALAGARARCGANVSLVQADATQIPLPSGSFDVVYSFEVLEHLWDPVVALKEMARLLRPHGTLLVSTPNGYSLDLHLRRRPSIRCFDLLACGAVSIVHRLRRRCYENVQPDLTADPVYPDCDMISRVFPSNLRWLLPRLGCSVRTLSTFTFQIEKASDARRRACFQALEQCPILRDYGDHILLVAVKDQLPIC